MLKFEYSVRDHDLPKDAHRLRLVGSPRTLTWPDICPNCGARTSERIPVRKIFRRTEGSPRDAFVRYLIASVDVPFCTACAERHRRTEVPVTRGGILFSLFDTGLYFALASATVFAVIFFRPAVLDIRRDGASGWVWLVFFGCFALAIVASVLSAWRQARFLRVPRQTEITRAFDFSDDLGNWIVGERRVVAIRNAAFAQALASANPERLWTEAVQARDRRRVTAFAVLLLAALLAASLLMTAA